MWLLRQMLLISDLEAERKRCGRKTQNLKSDHRLTWKSQKQLSCGDLAVESKAVSSPAALINWLELINKSVKSGRAVIDGWQPGPGLVVSLSHCSRLSLWRRLTPCLFNRLWHDVLNGLNSHHKAPGPVAASWAWFEFWVRIKMLYITAETRGTISLSGRNREEQEAPWRGRFLLGSDWGSSE